MALSNEDWMQFYFEQQKEFVRYMSDMNDQIEKLQASCEAQKQRLQQEIDYLKQTLELAGGAGWKHSRDLRQPTPPPRAPLGTELARDVAKLLPLLASDRDGEVLGAVAALKRRLRKDGLDLNDLAARL